MYKWLVRGEFQQHASEQSRAVQGRGFFDGLEGDDVGRSSNGTLSEGAVALLQLLSRAE